MNYVELPSKEIWINFIRNDKKKYLLLRVSVITTVYTLTTFLWIGLPDKILGYDRDVLEYIVCIIMPFISLIMYCYSKYKIKKYINCCKGMNFSNDILEELEDEKQDTKMYSIVITAVVAAVGNLIGALLKQNKGELSTGIPNGTLFIFGNAMFVLFILVGIIYPAKKLQDGLIKIIEDKKKKNTNDNILRSISEIKRLVIRNKRYKR